MADKKDNINLRSDEVQDILGTTPNWLVRAGSSMFFAVLLGLLIGCWFFKYPDIISARTEITTKNPPAQLRAMTTGKVTHMLANEGDMIEVGDLIAVIENSSNVKDVLNFKSKIASIHKPQDFRTNNHNYQLGEIQTYYASFLGLIQEYNSYCNLNIYGQKIKNLYLNKKSLILYLKQQQAQLEVKYQEVKIVQRQQERDSLLREQAVLSSLDYEKSEQVLLQEQMSLENINGSIIQAQMQIEQNEREISELKLQDKQERKQMLIGISQAYQELNSQISQWERTFLIRSPINGKVTFTQIWSENQNVKQGEVVATVVPDEKQNLIGKIFIPSTGMGKVTKGQTVNIKLDNYPYMEFGILKASIQSISLVPTALEDGSIIYTADVKIPENLKTNYGTELVFSQEMTGTAEIITDDIRLLQRFFSPIKSIFKENVRN